MLIKFKRSIDSKNATIMNGRTDIFTFVVTKTDRIFLIVKQTNNVIIHIICQQNAIHTGSKTLTDRNNVKTEYEPFSRLAVSMYIGLKKVSKTSN